MTRSEATQLASSLYETWGPTLWRLAYRATRSADEADDVLQEAFMAFYRALRADANLENPRAWLLAVVRHQISKLGRTHRRRQEQLQPQDVMDSFPAESGELCAQFLPEFDLSIYSPVLSKREEEVVMLRLASLKYREIARELGIATRAVSTLLARALTKLQAAVERHRAGLSVDTGKRRETSKTLQ